MDTKITEYMGSILPSKAPQAPNPPSLQQPVTVRDTGLKSDLLAQLILKVMYFKGEVTGYYLSDRLKLPYSIIDEMMSSLRAQNFCEVKGMDGGSKVAFRYGITGLGRDRAREFLEISQYTGAAPVTLSQYTEVMQSQTVLTSPVNRELLERGFSHLVFRDGVIDLIGQAINSGKAMFLYGPSGNGKTSISEAIGNVISHMTGSEIYIPYAVEVDSHIITVFDQVNHVPVAQQKTSSLVRDDLTHDARWVLCERPVVFVGGEMSLNMLDLSFNSIAKFYEAPLQMKSNGGVFVVDDFGRQLVSPWDLLNRWIVPLEKGVDYLTLHTGKKFPIPFDSLVIFATNLEPQSLVDEAFFRRIRFKMAVEDPSLEIYSLIFKKYCASKGIDYDPEIIDYLHKEYYQKYNIRMRCCHPRDIIDQVLSVARFMGIPPTLSKSLVDKACRTYFILKK